MLSRKWLQTCRNRSRITSIFSFATGTSLRVQIDLPNRLFLDFAGHNERIGILGKTDGFTLALNRECDRSRALFGENLSPGLIGGALIQMGGEIVTNNESSCVG